jgi:DNA-binding LacI/PurR family transcriptional regulator
MRKSTSRPALTSGVTIKEIAEYLSISHSTVSRALSDHPYTNAETKQRVRRAVEKLGYVPNAAARSLRSDKGSLVGLILPEFQNELFAAAAQILSRRCLKEGMQMMLAVSEDDPVAEYKHVLALREARTLGIIMTPTPGMLDKTIALLRGLPMVQYSRRHPQLSAPSVTTDGERGIFTATEHLLQLGHRRIAYVGMECDKSTGAERLAGFMRAHNAFKAPADAALRRLGPSLADFARAAVTDLLHRADPPTAVILASGAQTLGGLKALRHSGLDMPGDISLIGFGDPSWYSLMNPGITTIDYQVTEMAEAAASHLMRQLSPGADAAEQRATHIAIEPSFLLRGTTAPPKKARASKRPSRRLRATAARTGSTRIST